MAKSDVKSSGGGGSWGGGGSEYNDEGRGRSKELWENFEASYDNNDHDCSWLFTLPDRYLYNYVRGTTWRYNVADGPRVWTGNYAADGRDGEWLDKQHAGDDSRMARIIKKHCGDDVWMRFSKHITDAWARHKATLQEEQDRRDREYHAGDGKRAEERQAREAEQLKLRVEETQKIRDEVEMTVGMLRSDVHDVFSYAETYGLRDGDWLDNPVAAYATGYGFGEEVKERSGVKLQVTVSLDLSNSMYYNGIHDVALEAFRTLVMTLESIQKEYVGDVFTAAFKFSLEDDGKHAARIGASQWDSDLNDAYDLGTDEYDLGTMERWRTASCYSSWRQDATFSGEDTWLYPLFTEIEKWENAESDPGAIRLDIVITDAVLEHPKDIRESSIIQERRNGTLQTVLLNLMPEDRWLDSTLPLRCVQYPANRDNLAGLLRNVLAEFVSVYV